jgi:hypothetical protein
MKTTLMRSILLVVLCVTVQLASAAVIPLTTNLSGPTSTGAATTGTGTFTGAFDTTAATLSVDVVFNGLTSPTGGTTPPAHIHQASVPGGSGPVIIPFPGFPTGVMSGSYMQTLNLTTTQYNNFVAALTAGTAYVNLHSVAFPAGEIRGDLPQVGGLQAIPEPGTVLLIGSGLLAAAALKRYRKA